MRKFWNWVRDETTEDRTLYLNGEISDETWWGDEVTPKLFKDELMADSGNVTVWINSPGGDVFAAAQIYNMLMDYTGQVTVKIDGLAASAASVIAMAGGDVYMSPVSMLMIHNPSTIAIGDSEEMLRAKALLDEVKESIINAYELKSGLSRTKLSHLMDAETWMNANKAIELGPIKGLAQQQKNPARGLKRAQAPSPLARAFSATKKPRKGVEHIPVHRYDRTFLSNKKTPQGG